MGDRTGADPYRILGVRRNATSSDVARAYRALAKQAHPDLHGPEASRRMQELNRAFFTLGDPARRRAYDAAHPTHASPSHWAGSPREPRRGESSAGPSTWSTWEAATAPRAAAQGSVRPAASWPRAEAPVPVAGRGARDSAWIAVAVALAMVVSVIGLAWYASTGSVARSAGQAFAQLGQSPLATVRVDATHEIGTYSASNGALGVMVATFDGDRWSARTVTEVVTRHPFSVLLAVSAPQAGEPWGGIAFGRAPGAVERVSVSGGEGVGGEVSSGTWAVALPRSFVEEDLDWEFVLGDGTVLISGSGELVG